MSDTKRTDTPRCKQQVADYSMRFPRYHQCRFKASRDGFCKIHHPDSVKAREEKQRARYEAEREKSPYMLLHKATERNQQLERELSAEREKVRELREALAQIEDHHNEDDSWRGIAHHALEATK